MGFEHAKYITELEEVCLIELKKDFEKMRGFSKKGDPECKGENPFRAPDLYAEKIFGDWIEYCDETIKLHQHAFKNAQKLPASLKEENKGMVAAKQALDDYGKSDPDAKKHIKWLIKLLDIEIEANKRILAELDGPDRHTLCKEPEPDTRK